MKIRANGSKAFRYIVNLRGVSTKLERLNTTLTIAVTVFVALVSFSVIIEIFLRGIFYGRTIITQIAESVFVEIVLISVRDPGAIVLRWKQKDKVRCNRLPYISTGFQVYLYVPAYCKLYRCQYHCHTHLQHRRHQGLSGLDSLDGDSCP